MDTRERKLHSLAGDISENARRIEEHEQRFEQRELEFDELLDRVTKNQELSQKKLEA